MGIPGGSEGWWHHGHPRWLSCKESTCQCRRRKRCGFDPWIGKIFQRRKWHPTPLFLPEKSHKQRCLAGYSPTGCKELDMNEQLSTCLLWFSHVQLCNTMDCNTPGFPDFRCLQEFAQIHVRWVCDAVQPSHPLSTQHVCLMTLPVCRALAYFTVSSCSTHIVPQKYSIETGKITMKK